MEQLAQPESSAAQTAVIDSFDRIARHSTADAWDHNSHYHAYLLRHLPAQRGTALDVGSGLGAFSRLLADRFDQVEGIDFSPEMVARAAAHTVPHPNLHYTCGDFLLHPYPLASFDCVACIAALHHLPIPGALVRMADLLKPGGRLMVLDLCRAPTPGERLLTAAGYAACVVIRLAHRARPSGALRAAWREHGPLDHYLSITDVKRVCVDLVPGARVHRHLCFRYSLIWEKE